MSTLGPCKPFFQKYFIECKGVIHAGAWRGTEIAEYVDCGFDHIAMFEPQSRCFESLENARREHPVATIHKVALGDTNSKMTMNICNEFDMTSSLLNPSELFYNSNLPQREAWVTEEVDVHRLDDYTEINHSDYNVLVMDTQGYELHVLRGAVDTLENIDIIFTEINKEALYDGSALINELDIFLTSQGFIREDTSWGGGIWGDAIYLKK